MEPQTNASAAYLRISQMCSNDQMTLCYLFSFRLYSETIFRILFNAQGITANETTCLTNIQPSYGTSSID